MRLSWCSCACQALEPTCRCPQRVLVSSRVAPAHLQPRSVHDPLPCTLQAEHLARSVVSVGNADPNVCMSLCPCSSRSSCIRGPRPLSIASPTLIPLPRPPSSSSPSLPPCHEPPNGRPQSAKTAPILPRSTEFTEWRGAANPGPGQYDASRTFTAHARLKGKAALTEEDLVVRPSTSVPSIPRYATTAPPPPSPLSPIPSSLCTSPVILCIWFLHVATFLLAWAR